MSLPLLSTRDRRLLLAMVVSAVLLAVVADGIASALPVAATVLPLALGWWLSLALLAVAGARFRSRSSAPPVALAGQVVAAWLANLAIGGTVVLVMALPLVFWLRSPGLLAVLVMAAAAVMAVLLVVRRWPLAYLPVLPRHADEVAGARPVDRFRRAASSARALVRDHDPLSERALPMAFVHAALLLLPLVGWLYGRAGTWSTGLAIIVALVVMALLQAWGEARCLALLDGVGAGDVAGPVEDGTDEPPLPQSALHRTVALRTALHEGRIDTALKLLAAGADVVAPPWPDEIDQRDALTIAATLNDSRPLRAMIAAGVDVNHAGNGLTPLLAATRDSYYGRPEIVMSLLANGADLHARDSSGCTALHHAALSVDPTVAVMLLDAGASVDVIDNDGYTPLARACSVGNAVLLPVFLQRKPTLDPPGSMPVLCAAAGAADDGIDCVTALLKARRQVDQADEAGRTPLHHAAAAGNERIARVLLENGADANVVDGDGRTPLHLACAVYDADGPLVRLLLEAGADLDLADGEGVTPMLLRRVRGIDAMGDLPVADGIDAAGQALLLHGRHGAVRVWLRQATSEQRAALLLEAARLGSMRVLGEALSEPLSSDVRLPDGRLLLDAALTIWPGSRPILAALTGTSGAGSLARLLRAFPVAGNEPDAEALALAWLAAGADPFHDPNGGSPLHLAAALGFERLVAALLDAGVDAGRRDASGRTPLHCVLMHDDALAQRLVTRLLRHGADPDAVAANGETPLALALDAHRQSLADWLHWPDWRAPLRRLAEHDLVAAAAQGNAEVVRRLLDLGLPVDGRDRQACTALIRAAGAGHRDVVERLLDRGASLDASAGTGMTALGAAVVANQVDLIQLLVDRGARVEQRLARQTTALLVAVACGHVAATEALLALGADIAVVDGAGNTVLHAAAGHAFGSDDDETVRRLLRSLLSAGAVVDAGNGEGMTALHVACGAAAATRAGGRGVQAALDILLARSNLVTLVDDHGRSPLHYASAQGQLDAVRRLIARGAEIGLADKGGWRPEHYAAHYGYTDVVQALRAGHGDGRAMGGPQ